MGARGWRYVARRLGTGGAYETAACARWPRKRGGRKQMLPATSTRGAFGGKDSDAGEPASVIAVPESALRARPQRSRSQLTNVRDAGRPQSRSVGRQESPLGVFPASRFDPMKLRWISTVPAPMQSPRMSR